jgi:general secretion pathway protein K
LRSAEASGRQRGVALLMVLIAMTILAAMTVDFMESSEVYVANTANQRDSLKAEYLARSSVNLSRLMLSVQPLLGGAFNFPFWQYADVIMEPFTSTEGDPGMMGDLIGINLAGSEGLGIADGDFSVLIVDEDSKINVNVGGTASVKERERMVTQLAMLMSPMEYDTLFDRQTEGGKFFERQDVICEIIDWADPDEDLCDLSGPEDVSYYSSMDPEYGRKNAPYDSLEELHLVQGIGDDFWSAFVDPNPEDPEQRVMTVWGRGQVNVNTAPAQVLFAQVCMAAADENGISPCIDPVARYNLLQILQAVVLLRTFMPFSKPGDFISAIENPQERLFLPISGVPIPNKRDAAKMLATQSSVFSIYAEGTVGRARKRIHTVIDIQGTDMLDPVNSIQSSGGSILYWRME